MWYCTVYDKRLEGETLVVCALPSVLITRQKIFSGKDLQLMKIGNNRESFLSQMIYCTRYCQYIRGVGRGGSKGLDEPPFQTRI